MSLGDRIGLGGLLVALLSIAAFYLWPDRKWIGWLSLAASLLLLVGWGYLEEGDLLLEAYKAAPVRTSILVGVVGGLMIGVGFWKLAKFSSVPTQSEGSLVSGSQETPKAPSPTELTHVIILSRDQPEDRTGWRTLTDWQKVRLAAVVSRYPSSKLHIIASSFGKETWNYALQFRDVFHQAGWKVVGPDTAPIDQPAMDIQLSVNEKYWTRGLPPEFGAVNGVLPEIGVRKRKTHILDPLVAADELVMWVGAKGPDNDPPDNHPPLMMVEATCQHPLKFTDTPVHPLQDNAPFARAIKIVPPHLRFSAQDRVLVLLTAEATVVNTAKENHIGPMGTIMPRNDILVVTVGKTLEEKQTLDLTVSSDKDIKVRCVDDYFRKEPGH
jgi:hypothetical protein